MLKQLKNWKANDCACTLVSKSLFLSQLVKGFVKSEQVCFLAALVFFVLDILQILRLYQMIHVVHQYRRISYSYFSHFAVRCMTPSRRSAVQCRVVSSPGIPIPVIWKYKVSIYH